MNVIQAVFEDDCTETVLAMSDDEERLRIRLVCDYLSHEHLETLHGFDAHCELCRCIADSIEQAVITDG
jgi:hypothetical protein